MSVHNIIGVFILTLVLAIAIPPPSHPTESTLIKLKPFSLIPMCFLTTITTPPIPQLPRINDCPKFNVNLFKNSRMRYPSSRLAMTKHIESNEGMDRDRIKRCCISRNNNLSENKSNRFIIHDHYGRREIIRLVTSGVSILQILLPVTFTPPSNAVLSGESKSESYLLTPSSEQSLESLCGKNIVAEDKVPGAYQQICMNLPERSIVLKTTGERIMVYQDSVGGITGRTGVALWNSGLLLARLLDEIALAEGDGGKNSISYWFEGSKEGKDSGTVIMELGCGTGLASIVFSKLYFGSRDNKDIRIFASDGNEEIVALASRNMIQNNVVSIDAGLGDILLDDRDIRADTGPKQQPLQKGVEVNTKIKNTDTNVKIKNRRKANKEEKTATKLLNGKAIVLKWGLIDAADFYSVADLVIGSDLTYNPGTWRVLVESIGCILKPGGYFLYLTLGHSGFDVSAELNGFLTVVESDGALEIVSDLGGASPPSTWPFQKVRSLNLLLQGLLEEGEKEIIASAGGVRVLLLRKKKRF